MSSTSTIGNEASPGWSCLMIVSVDFYQLSDGSEAVKAIIQPGLQKRCVEVEIRSDRDYLYAK